MDSGMNKELKDILKHEIDTLEKYLKYNEEKNEKLKNSLNNISKYIDEDKRIMNASRNYVKEHDFCSGTKIDEEEIFDNIVGVYSKMDILHSQLCSLTKKFAKLYSSQSNSDLSKAKSDFSNSPTKCKPKNSLLEILKVLMYDLNPNSDRKDYGTMGIDDTVRLSDVEFLVSAGIVKRRSRSLECISLNNYY